MNPEGGYPHKWMAAILRQSYVKPVVGPIIFTAGVAIIIVVRVELVRVVVQVAQARLPSDRA